MHKHDSGHGGNSSVNAEGSIFCENTLLSKSDQQGVIGLKMNDLTSLSKIRVIL